jgi:succinate dehydrogenase / fumarate reductase membrane anchor subunit
MVAKSTLMKWHYITGLIMIIVVGIHIAYRWPSYDASVSWPAVQNQISMAWYDIVLLIIVYAASYHAMNGLRTIMLELFHGGKAFTTFVDVLVIALGLLVVVVGTYTIISLIPL